jgi:acetyltransferase
MFNFLRDDRARQTADEAILGRIGGAGSWTKVHCLRPDRRFQIAPGQQPQEHPMGTDIRLRDGRTVQVRATSADDEAELLQLFGRMSEHARYMRTMRVMREPNRERMRAVLASFPGDGIGVVATVPAVDGIDIVGSAVAIFDGQRTGCEFATTVDATYGGAGLGTVLMTALIDEARRRGLREMEGFVLAENKAMLALARKLGFSVRSEPGDAAVRICRLPLDQP